MLFGVKANVGSNPTVTAMETPEKSGVFPYPESGVVHLVQIPRLSRRHLPPIQGGMPRSRETAEQAGF